MRRKIANGLVFLISIPLIFTLLLGDPEKED